MSKEFVNGTIKDLIEWVSANVPMSTENGKVVCKYCGKVQKKKPKHEKDCLHIRARALKDILIEGTE